MSGSGGHREEIRRAAEAILCSPARVAGRIAQKMHVLARAERFEEAAEVRGRGASSRTFLSARSGFVPCWMQGGSCSLQETACS